MNIINELGLKKENIRENLSVSALINEAVRRGEGSLTADGALLIKTGQYTGRSPKDRFIVVDSISKDTVAFGKVNLPIEKDVYHKLREKVKKHLEGREMFLVKSVAGANREHGITVNVFAENAAQAVFANQIFIKDRNREGYDADFTVVAVPSLKAEGKNDDVNSEAFVIISLEDRLVMIGGTLYSGEIKKSIFSVMNFLLPEKGILPMHCSCNMDNNGNTALFFGLSGTGKTTLSADPKRNLIGDDEHGWSDDGVFNFEGGCYAKTINLDKEKEREIYNAIRFGSVLENVICDKDGVPDYTDKSLTENTRCTYPINYIDNAILEGKGGIPKTVVFLTADAFGVIPPISKLTKDSAMYHFMSGYTSKLAGTERGIVNPETTFSALFGEPFMIRPIEEYAELLGKMIDKYNTDVYLINTGWTGGKYGTGSRMPLRYTRKMVDAALRGDLKDTVMAHDEIFNLDVPKFIEDVPDEILIPETQWKDKEDYKKTALELAEKFKENFKRFPKAPENIVKAGPR